MSACACTYTRVSKLGARSRREARRSLSARSAPPRLRLPGAGRQEFGAKPGCAPARSPGARRMLFIRYVGGVRMHGVFHFSNDYHTYVLPPAESRFGITSEPSGRSCGLMMSSRVSKEIPDGDVRTYVLDYEVLGEHLRERLWLRTCSLRLPSLHMYVRTYVYTWTYIHGDFV